MTPIDCDDEAEQALRYWKAAISSLSTPEKREAAERFLRTTLEGGRGADALIGIVLILEANGAFLLDLPQRIHGEITHPIDEKLFAFRNELLAHFERQRAHIAAFDSVRASVASAAELIQQTQQDLASKIRNAADNVDAAGMATQISQTIEFSTLRPLKHSLRDLDQSMERAKQAADAAERSVDAWRRMHLRGIVVGSLLVSLLIAGCILCWGWWQMENRYRTRLAAQVFRLSAIDDDYRQLLWLGISFRLAPWEDESGKPAKDRYTITVDDAEAVATKEIGRGKKAVVLVKAQSLVERIESVKAEVRKLQGDLPQQKQGSR